MRNSRFSGFASCASSDNTIESIRSLEELDVTESAISEKLRAYLDDVSLVDLQAMHLLLEGSSIIDWPRPTFNSIEHAWRLMEVNGYSWKDPRDMERIQYLLGESADYLEQTFGFAIPPDLLQLDDPGEMFLIASNVTHPHQRLAWMLIKVLHVLNHVQGRELGHLLATSDQELFKRVQGMVANCIGKMRDIGIGVAEYQSSFKSKESLITKLLSKRNTIAAQIFDKVRFRIILEDESDIFPALLFMTRELLPFNYVIPGETRNDIVGIHQEVMRFPHLIPTLLEFAREQGIESELHERPSPARNPATEESYKVVNFVVDLPVRALDFLREYELPYTKELGAQVFVLVEFQIFDKKTYERNESGPARHSLYKDRQKKMVLGRLVRGAPDREGD